MLLSIDADVRYSYEAVADPGVWTLRMIFLQRLKMLLVSVADLMKLNSIDADLWGKSAEAVADLGVWTLRLIFGNRWRCCCSLMLILWSCRWSLCLNFAADFRTSWRCCWSLWRILWSCCWSYEAPEHWCWSLMKNSLKLSLILVSEFRGWSFVTVTDVAGLRC